MAFGIARTARSRHARAGLRALFGGKAPTAEELGDRVGRLAKRMFRVRDASPRRWTIELHPRASPATIAILPDGDLELRAETFALGPGYHAFVATKLDALIEELDFAWVGDPPGDPTAGMLAELAVMVRGDPPIHINMPRDRQFLVDAPVLTALGPRDAAWIADASHHADVFPWPARGGSRDLATALLALWHDVPWRAPIDEDERTLMELTEAQLRAAHAAGLGVPLGAWAELCHLLGRDAPAAPPDDRAPIGYRRHDVVAEIDGWQLHLPGSFLGGLRDDIYVATDGDRAVELATITVDDDTLDTAALLAIAPERFSVVAREADRRAEGYAEDGVRVIHGLVAAPPHVAILTCKGDEAWGLRCWRSLRRA